MGPKAIKLNRKVRRTAEKNLGRLAMQNSADAVSTMEEVQAADTLEVDAATPMQTVVVATDSPSLCQVDSAGDVESESSAKPKRVSKTKLTIERIREVQAKCISEGKEPSYRNILKVLGGSFSTINKLMNAMERMENDPIDTEITVSDATKDAIAADIVRHLEQFQASIKHKLDIVESCKGDLQESSETIDKLQQIIEEKNNKINELIAINAELRKALDK